MQAYNNDIEFKQNLVCMSEAHMAADEFIQGEYGQINGTFRGCSLGCTIHDVNKIMGLNGDVSDHSFLSDSIGIPVFLTQLQEYVFEGLDIDYAKKWTPRFLSSIVEGVDLNPVLPIFLLKLLNNLPEQEIEEVSAAINGSKKILAGWISTGKPDFAAAASAASADYWVNTSNILIESIEQVCRKS